MIYTQPILITRFAPTAASDIGVFEGLASTAIRDRHGDVVAKGAFGESIEALAAGSRRIPLLLEHNPGQHLGGIKSAVQTDEGLRVVGQIVLGTPNADRVYQLSKAGEMGLSIGFLPVEHEDIPGGGTLYRRVDLLEISAVATPSNRESRILSIKALADCSHSEIEKLLRDGSMPPIPRRLAAKMARLCVSATDEDLEPEHDPADIAAIEQQLEALKQGLSKSFSTIFKGR